MANGIHYLRHTKFNIFVRVYVHHRQREWNLLDLCIYIFMVGEKPFFSLAELNDFQNHLLIKYFLIVSNWMILKENKTQNVSIKDEAALHWNLKCSWKLHHKSNDQIHFNLKINAFWIHISKGPSDQKQWSKSHKVVVIGRWIAMKSYFSHCKCINIALVLDVRWAKKYIIFNRVDVNRFILFS